MSYLYSQIHQLITIVECLASLRFNNTRYHKIL